MTHFQAYDNAAVIIPHGFVLNIRSYSRQIYNLFGMIQYVISYSVITTLLTLHTFKFFSVYTVNIT